MAVKKEVIIDMLKAKIPDAKIQLVDTVGDMDHYDLQIASGIFVGLSKIKQHQLVLSALGEMVGNELHAISIKTQILG